MTALCQMLSVITSLIIYKKTFHIVYSDIIIFSNLKFRYGFACLLTSVGLLFCFRNVFMKILSLIIKVDTIINVSGNKANYANIIYISAAVISGPIIEELCFRIIPVYLSKNKIEISVIVLINSILFSLFHFRGTPDFFMLLFISLILFFTYVITRNGAYPILIHIVYNLTSETMSIVSSLLGFDSIYVIKNGYIFFSRTIELIGAILLVIGIAIATFPINYINKEDENDKGNNTAN